VVSSAPAGIVVRGATERFGFLGGCIGGVGASRRKTYTSRGEWRWFGLQLAGQRRVAYTQYKRLTKGGTWKVDCTSCRAADVMVVEHAVTTHKRRDDAK
jgi:hypothetical protein